MKRAAAAVLTLLAALALTVARSLETASVGDRRAPAAEAEADPGSKPEHAPEAPRAPVVLPDGRTALDEEPSLHALPADPRLHQQVRTVISAVDATGRPPRGVVQGGRRGGRRGLFENSEGRLPAQPRGYYTESDVWPRQGRRGPERLVFGRDGEVFYSPDHYRTFVRIR